MNNFSAQIMCAAAQHSQNWAVWIAPAATILVAILANIVIWRKVRADLASALLKEHHLRVIEHLSGKLEKLYNPILSFSHVNSEIFITFGPPAFPEDVLHRQEAALVWQQMVADVIIPNNKAIREAIIQYGHFASAQDEQDECARFVCHSLSYETFRKNPNSQHKNFEYPERFVPTLSEGKKRIENRLRTAESDFNPQ